MSIGGVDMVFFAFCLDFTDGVKTEKGNNDLPYPFVDDSVSVVSYRHRQ